MECVDMTNVSCKIDGDCSEHKKGYSCCKQKGNGKSQYGICVKGKGENCDKSRGIPFRSCKNSEQIALENEESYDTMESIRVRNMEHYESGDCDDNSEEWNKAMYTLFIIIFIILFIVTVSMLKKKN
jgi:hypothetical protein